MTVADYKPFVERMIFRYEGNYGWNRFDPGGPTKFGVTCWDLAKHRHQVMDSMVRWAPIVQAMPLSEADDIIDVDYAQPCRFNDLGPGKDCAVLDFGYNSGPPRSIKYAQRVVGVAMDGILGPITLNAVNNFNPQDFINDLCNVRLNFLQGLGTWPEFGAGWHARVEDLRSYSLNLALVPKKLTSEGYTDKLERIPLAFAKAYASDDLPK